jgi:hypothetical protein
LRWHRVSLGLAFEFLVRDLISRPTPKQTLQLILLPSDLDYVSWVSLGGAIGLVTLATIGLVGIYLVRRD